MSKSKQLKGKEKLTATPLGDSQRSSSLGVRAFSCKFRHFSRTSAVVRIATPIATPHSGVSKQNKLSGFPIAFTASAIFLHISFFFLIGDALGKLALYQRKVFFNSFRQNGNF